MQLLTNGKRRSACTNAIGRYLSSKPTDDRLTTNALVLHVVIHRSIVTTVLTLVHGDEGSGDVTARLQAALLKRRFLDVLVVFEAVAVGVDAGVATEVVDVSGACFTAAHYAHDVNDVVLTAVDDDTTWRRPFVAHREIKRVCNS